MVVWVCCHWSMTNSSCPHIATVMRKWVISGDVPQISREKKESCLQNGLKKRQRCLAAMISVHLDRGQGWEGEGQTVGTYAVAHYLADMVAAYIHTQPTDYLPAWLGPSSMQWHDSVSFESLGQLSWRGYACHSVLFWGSLWMSWL